MKVYTFYIVYYFSGSDSYSMERSKVAYSTRVKAEQALHERVAQRKQELGFRLSEASVCELDVL